MTATTKIEPARRNTERKTGTLGRVVVEHHVGESVRLGKAAMRAVGCSIAARKSQTPSPLCASLALPLRKGAAQIKRAGSIARLVLRSVDACIQNRQHFLQYQCWCVPDELHVARAIVH